MKNNEHSNLVQSEIFKRLPPDELARLDRKARRIEYAKGEVLYNSGDRADFICFVACGKVKLGAYSSEGKEIIKSVLMSGEFFGELALFGLRTRNNFTQSIEDGTVVYQIDVDYLQELMRTYSYLGVALTEHIGQRLLSLEKRLESIVFKDARTRIIDLIKDLAARRGKKIGYETLIWNFLTHNDIANLTATSRQTVNAVLNELRDQNLIYFDRKRILIRDMERLG